MLQEADTPGYRELSQQQQGGPQEIIGTVQLLLPGFREPLETPGVLSAPEGPWAESSHALEEPGSGPGLAGGSASNSRNPARSDV